MDETKPFTQGGSTIPVWSRQPAKNLYDAMPRDLAGGFEKPFSGGGRGGVSVGGSGMAPWETPQATMQIHPFPETTKPFAPPTITTSKPPTTLTVPIASVITETPKQTQQTRQGTVTVPSIFPISGFERQQEQQRNPFSGIMPNPFVRPRPQREEEETVLPIVYPPSNLPKPPAMDTTPITIPGFDTTPIQPTPTIDIMPKPEPPTPFHIPRVKPHIIPDITPNVIPDIKPKPTPNVLPDVIPDIMPNITPINIPKVVPQPKIKPTPATPGFAFTMPKTSVPKGFGWPRAGGSSGGRGAQNLYGKWTPRKHAVKTSMQMLGTFGLTGGAKTRGFGVSVKGVKPMVGKLPKGVGSVKLGGMRVTTTFNLPRHRTARHRRR